MSDGSHLTLDAWLRAAYAPEAGACPPPEAFLEEEMARLSPGERQALEEHAAHCPACAAEQDLARLFDAAPEEADVAPEDLDFVVSRLAPPAAPPATAPVPSNVVPFPGPRRTPEAPRSQPRSRTLFRFAAAALVVMGVGLAYRAYQSPEPGLPPPELGGEMRGGAVEALSPVGEVADLPAELRWSPAKDAAAYRVRITAVDGSVLWETTVRQPAAPLPAEVGGRLHRAVRYTWTVEALDAQGGRLALSAPVSFQMKPEPEKPSL